MGDGVGLKETRYRAHPRLYRCPRGATDLVCVAVLEHPELLVKMRYAGGSKISDPARASKDPLTSAELAQLSAEALRLAVAYQASRALHVALRLGLPDLLAGAPETIEN